MSIAINVAEIRRQMEAAALAAGRDPKEILLCAATKMNDAVTGCTYRVEISQRSVL